MAKFTLLHRVNPDRNEARFYAVMVGPSLGNPLSVMRFWGRIGGWQRALITPCATKTEARKLAGRLVASKLKKGYKVVIIPPKTERKQQ